MDSTKSGETGATEVGGSPDPQSGASAQPGGSGEPQGAFPPWPWHGRVRVELGDRPVDWALVDADGAPIARAAYFGERTTLDAIATLLNAVPAGSVPIAGIVGRPDGQLHLLDAAGRTVATMAPALLADVVKGAPAGCGGLMSCNCRAVVEAEADWLRREQVFGGESSGIYFAEMRMRNLMSKIPAPPAAEGAGAVMCAKCGTDPTQTPGRYRCSLVLGTSRRPYRVSVTHAHVRGGSCGRRRTRGER